MTTPTLSQFKAFAADIAPAVRAVCLAQAFADLERARVDAYIAPVFAGYTFTVAQKWQDRGRPERITKPGDLYLSDDDALCADFYAACDAAHRAHGFDGPAGYCPALIAENLLIKAQNALIDLAGPFFGVDFHSCCFGDDRKKLLDLLLGAGVKADRERVA